MAEETNRIRVLVVDKSRVVRDLVAERVLIPNGYRPILASDGVQGVRKALTEIPDLILLDHAVPKLSSLEVLETLRSRPLQVPVILMTSRDAQEFDLRFLRLGVRDCIIKPFRADQLLQAIQNVTFEVQLRRERTDLAQRLAQADRKIKQCLVEFRICHKIGEAVKAHTPLDVLFERIAEAALYITHSEECFLVLNDPETGERTETVTKRRTRGLARPLAPYAGAEPGQPGTIAAMLHIPLKAAGKEIGVLGVNNKAALRSFGEHERQLLRVLADYAAIAVAMARLSTPQDPSWEVEV